METKTLKDYWSTIEKNPWYGRKGEKSNFVVEIARKLVKNFQNDILLKIMPTLLINIYI